MLTVLEFLLFRIRNCIVLHFLWNHGQKFGFNIGLWRCGLFWEIVVLGFVFRVHNFAGVISDSFRLGILDVARFYEILF